MSSIINGFIIFSLTVTLAYFVGLLAFLTDHEENKCEMTFMFEYPQFVRVWNEADEMYPKYGLYAYGEGRWTEKIRDMHFDGVPVLFVPGNAGSHKQVRSLASIALRKSLNSRTPFHFDYFAVDLNGELSGLNGALLDEQLQYVNHSLFRVLELYQHRNNPPKSVVLFGHSMGGVIARHLASILPDPSLVSIVLTLASPHRRPPLMLDSHMHGFYKSIKFYEPPPPHVTFVSISGGFNDFLVPSFLAEIPHNNSLSVVTTQVPLGWLPVDHVCILWCKQTTLAINRALFDSVDPKTKQISTDVRYVRSVFRHHLVHHSGIKTHLRHSYSLTPNIRNDGDWIENLQRQYTALLTKGVKETHWYMIKLLDQMRHEALTVVALNLETVDWAFACGAHIPRGSSRVCEEFVHLTHMSEISPSARYKRRTLRINLHQLLRNNSALTHVVVRVLPTSEPVILHFDVYNVEERTITVSLPSMVSLKSHVVLEETPEKAVSFELALPQLHHVTQSYGLHVETLKCANEFNHATASLIVPWGNQNYHKHFTDADRKPMHLRLQTSRPQSHVNRSAKVRLALDPTCRYRISVRSSVVGMLGQMARFYTPLLLVNVAAVVLMALSSQLKTLSTSRHCSMFFAAIKEGAKPYYILTGVKLISRIFSIHPLSKFIVVPDWLTMAEEGTDFFLLPLLLYTCSVGIVWILGIVLAASLVVFETTVHRVALKFLARTVTFTISWSDHLMSALHKVPFMVAGGLIVLSVATTGGLALFLGTVFYFLRLTQHSQDYIEELVWSVVKKLTKRFKKTTPDKTGTKKVPPVVKGDKLKKIESAGSNKDEKKDGNDDGKVKSSARDAMFFHATLFMVWALLTMINLPSVLTWAHNFKYATVLRPDPAFLPGFVLSVCALPLWQLELPKVRRMWYKEVGQTVVILSVVSLIFAPVSIFRLNYTLTMAVFLVTAHQVLGRDEEGEENGSGEEAESGEDLDEGMSYETVKAKLE